MKKYSLLPLMAMTFINVNAYALSGHGFKILNETIESSSGTRGWMKPATSNKPGMAQAWAMAMGSNGKAGENVVVSGSHTLAIKNDTKAEQIYTYKLELNCDGQFFRKIDKILLHPGGRVDDGAVSYLSTYHAAPGVYGVNAVTQIIGESSHQYVGTDVLNVAE